MLQAKVSSMCQMKLLSRANDFILCAVPKLNDFKQHRYLLHVPLHFPHAERFTFQGAIAIS